MAKILYLGNNDPSTTSCHRAHALRRLGHQVNVFDVDQMVADLPLADALEPLHFRTGYLLLKRQILNWLKLVIKRSPSVDLIWVNSGEKFGPECMVLLKELGVPIVLYNNDDPTGGRDGNKFYSLIKSIPYYDVCAVMREVNVDEFKNYGAKKVMRIWMSHDEVVHQPFRNTAHIGDYFRSDIVFIGTWMRHERRDEFLMHLLNSGLPLAIYGERWHKSPNWAKLQPYYRGGNLSGRDYVAAIQGAKICLGLLSKGNRDMHTQRSLEVPYAGGLLCAERTPEHQELYEEGVEAVFWDDAEECAMACKRLLADEARRRRILRNGMERVRNNRMGNEDMCFRILKEVNFREHDLQAS